MLGRPQEQGLLHLHPGMTAYSRISFAYLYLDTGEVCQPIAAWLHVTLPDDKGTFGVCDGLVIDPLRGNRFDG
jgi:hypothetical protein